MLPSPSRAEVDIQCRHGLKLAKRHATHEVGELAPHLRIRRRHSGKLRPGVVMHQLLGQVAIAGNKHDTIEIMVAQHHDAAGPQHAMTFAKKRFLVGNAFQHVLTDQGIKTAVLERQRLGRIVLHQPQAGRRNPGRLGPFRQGQLFRRDIQSDRAAIRQPSDPRAHPASGRGRNRDPERFVRIAAGSASQERDEMHWSYRPYYRIA